MTMRPGKKIVSCPPWKTGIDRFHHVNVTYMYIYITIDLL